MTLDDKTDVIDTTARPTVADRPGALAPRTEVARADSHAAPTIASPSQASSTITTAAEAMRDEELARTRLFIRMGWAISVAAIATVPLLIAPRATQIAMVGAMALGIVVSFGYHQAFTDPERYTESAMLRLAVMCVVNAHVAVLYYGAFTIAPVIVVVGVHFVARTEAERAAKWIYATAIACYTAIALPLIAGAFADPGVFATDRPATRATLAIGTAFVLGTYTLAYVTARAFRAASLASIDELQRATRLASQRSALMDELRADLERALRVGGPGRHTDRVVGGWKLGNVLGRGASGEVYDAVHVERGTPAAVKLLRGEMLADPTQVARFLREVRASGVLDSPHVVRVLDASADGDELPFLAMEKLAGATLAELLRRDPRLPAPDVVELVRQVGAGIDTAAAAGIVHRDLKPQNLVRGDATPAVWKILDFGVATLADNTSTLTQGGVVGTPSFMAPEQARGDRVDARADVYALAAIAYRCLTGRQPFVAADTPALLYAVVHRMPVRPTALAPLPADVDACLAIALAKSPDDRYASGAELARALELALAGALDTRARKTGARLQRARAWEAA